MKNILMLCVLFCSLVYSEERSDIVRLSLKDSISLNDLIAIQNADDAPLEKRRLIALHFFRRILQPTKPLAEWQQELTKLSWLRPNAVSFFGPIVGGYMPSVGAKTKSLVMVDVIPQKGVLFRAYIGFDVEHSESVRLFNFVLEGDALEFLTKTKGKITYLGLCQNNGFMENYRDEEFWFTYHPTGPNSDDGASK